MFLCAMSDFPENFMNITEASPNKMETFLYPGGDTEYPWHVCVSLRNVASKHEFVRKKTVTGGDPKYNKIMFHNVPFVISDLFW